MDSAISSWAGKYVPRMMIWAGPIFFREAVVGQDGVRDEKKNGSGKSEEGTRSARIDKPGGREPGHDGYRRDVDKHGEFQSPE